MSEVFGGSDFNLLVEMMWVNNMEEKMKGCCEEHGQKGRFPSSTMGLNISPILQIMSIEVVKICQKFGE